MNLKVMQQVILFQDREEILIAIDIDFSVSPNVKTIK